MQNETHRVSLTVSQPKTWPDLPKEMSFSLLRNLEACPRRWALSSAKYPDVWKKKGYPPSVQLPALAGVVVHRAVQSVTSALIRAGCGSLRTPEAIAIMKALGGYTTVLTRSIDEVLEEFVDNPRVAHLLDRAARTLKTQIPEMRSQVQSFLIRINFETTPHRTDRRTLPVGEKTRSALGPGTYPELDVRAPKIGWKGRIDLVTLSASKCEIVDFKTGAPSDDHSFQVLSYALLWSRDVELNPGARLANRLLLSYRSGDIEVNAPSSTELDAIERTLVDRTKAAQAAAALRPPQALPGAQNCRYCHVRHLCEAYWDSGVQRQLADARGDVPFFDLEATVLGKRGPSSWDGIVNSGVPQLVGKQIVLRIPPGWPEYAPRIRLRIMDVHVQMPEEGQDVVVVTLGTFSEAFLNN